MTHKAESRPGRGGSASSEGAGSSAPHSDSPAGKQASRIARTRAASAVPWPERIAVTEADVRRAGSVAAAREATFVKAGLLKAGPDAVRRARKVRLRAGDQIVAAVLW